MNGKKAMEHQAPSRRRFLGGVLGTGLGAALLRTGLAQIEAAESDAGFVSLFDGKSLAGWHTNAQEIVHGKGGRWSVEGGAITGEQDPPGSGNGGILMTDQDYG